MTTIHPQTFRLVAVDLYRNVHKAIRSELFAISTTAGSTDPHDEAAVKAMLAHLHSVIDLLDTHAGHEDTFVDPVLAEHLPRLAERIHDEHEALEATGRELVSLANALADAEDAGRRTLAQLLHLDLSAFTASYLNHQDVEERVVMPALEEAIGVPAVAAIQGAVVGSIPPEAMAQSLALMLPVMNIDDRAELLGGMRDRTPPDAFARVWSLTTSVLQAADASHLARRLDLV